MSGDQRSRDGIKINGQDRRGDWSGTTKKNLGKTPHRLLDQRMSLRTLARDSSPELIKSPLCCQPLIL